MKILLILLLIFPLVFGCSMAAYGIKDVDKHINDIVTNNPIVKMECRVGFYSGISFGTDNLKVSEAIQEMESLMIDKTPEIMKEYNRCKAVGLEVSILSIAGNEKAMSIINKILGMGIF